MHQRSDAWLFRFALLLFALGVAGDTNSSTDAGKDKGKEWQTHSSHHLLISCAYVVPCNFAKRRGNYDLKSNTDATYMKLIFNALISTPSWLSPPLHRDVATGAAIGERFGWKWAHYQVAKEYNKEGRKVALFLWQGGEWVEAET